MESRVGYAVIPLDTPPLAVGSFILNIIRTYEDIFMEGMTTDDKLLAQDDIDALLGEAGIEGNYDEYAPEKNDTPKLPAKKPVIRFSKITDDEAIATMTLLKSKAWLERGDDVKVIWNATGTIPMATGFTISIQDLEYISLGVLRDNHLVIKQKED